MEEEEIACRLLMKLLRLRAWGAKHISESNLQKGFPQQARGKIVLKVAEELRREGLLYKRPSSHDYQWSLVWERRTEIEIRVAKLLQPPQI
ncbi:MAG: hypothetical protein AABX01_03875 [Candidatus Micrarchaeota archaeon]